MRYQAVRGHDCVTILALYKGSLQEEVMLNTVTVMEIDFGIYNIAPHKPPIQELSCYFMEKSKNKVTGW